MVLRFLSLSFLLFLFSCSTGSVSESNSHEEKQESVEPKSLYVLHCESCHGMDGAKGLSDAADLSKSVLEDSKIKHVILNGNEKGMMPYKDLITNPTDVDNLVQYVKTLRK